MKKIMLVCTLFALAIPSYAMLANFVSSRHGISVSGQSVLICTYNANGQQFEKVFPTSVPSCPMTIEVY